MSLHLMTLAASKIQLPSGTIGSDTQHKIPVIAGKMINKAKKMSIGRVKFSITVKPSQG